MGGIFRQWSLIGPIQTGQSLNHTHVNFNLQQLLLYVFVCALR